MLGFHKRGRVDALSDFCIEVVEPVLQELLVQSDADHQLLLPIVDELTSQFEAQPTLCAAQEWNPPTPPAERVVALGRATASYSCTTEDSKLQEILADTAAVWTTKDTGTLTIRLAEPVSISTLEIVWVTQSPGAVYTFIPPATTVAVSQSGAIFNTIETPPLFDAQQACTSFQFWSGSQREQSRDTSYVQLALTAGRAPVSIKQIRIKTMDTGAANMPPRTVIQLITDMACRIMSVEQDTVAMRGLRLLRELVRVTGNASALLRLISSQLRRKWSLSADMLAADIQHQSRFECAIRDGVIANSLPVARRWQPLLPTLRPVFDPSTKASNVTLENDDTRFTTTSSTNSSCAAACGVSEGKASWEFRSVT